MPHATFNTFDLHPDILTNIHALGYKTPTPIQQKSIPAILLGQDLMGLAQTGTGKTAAFVLPILQRLMSGSRGHVRALIISPTRELAQQTHDAINTLVKTTLKIRSVALYGGVGIPLQIKNLRQADVVVACPGRLLDHIRQRTIDLTKVEILVLDEADHMFDVGFLPDVRKILQQLPRKRQSLLFSATMPSEVRKLAHDILKNPVTIQINNTLPVNTITQALYPVSQNLKSDLLIKLLQTHNIYSALVFTRTKHRAKRLAEQLEHAGYSATSLQGNLSQSKRQSALNNFRSGKLQILVATDIASRGIDIASISHVFNYDMPDTVEAYTHRIGRTGRASKLGDAFTLLTREDASKLRTLERVLGFKIEQRILPDFDYKAAGKTGGSTHADAPKPKRANKSFSGNRAKRFSDKKQSAFEFKSEKPAKYSKSRRPSSEQSGHKKSTEQGNYRNSSVNRGRDEKSAKHTKNQDFVGRGEKPVSRSRTTNSSKPNNKSHSHHKSQRPSSNKNARPARSRSQISS